MGFINKYLYNNRIKQLKARLEKIEIEKGVEYQTQKLIRMKNGDPVYLVHCSSSENGQVNLGYIQVLTSKGVDRSLKYLVAEDERRYIKIGAIGHEIRNQGIGTQLLAFLDEIAKQEGIYKITGWLSPVELENHRERLLHFCAKNGYQLTQGKMINIPIAGLIATKYC
jgi:GNAT superfamily N-acetyltransferase